MAPTIAKPPRLIVSSVLVVVVVVSVLKVLATTVFVPTTDEAVIPLIPIVTSTSTSAVHQLIYSCAVALEGILHLTVVALVARVVMSFYFLNATSIHFRFTIVFHLSFSFFTPLADQFALHIGLLTIPATDRCSVTTMRELLQLIDNVVASIVVAIVVMTVESV